MAVVLQHAPGDRSPTRVASSANRRSERRRLTVGEPVRVGRWRPRRVGGWPFQNPWFVAAQPPVQLGGALLVHVGCGIWIGKIRADRLPAGAVGAPQRADPHEHPRLRLGECPAAVLVGMVALARRPDVDLDGLAAATVLPGVVQIGVSGRPGATGAAAVAVPDPDVVGQRAAREPRLGVGRPGVCGTGRGRPRRRRSRPAHPPTHRGRVRCCGAAAPRGSRAAPPLRRELRRVGCR
jgi:hypothetical protein